ncbi:MAG: Short-chain dehydrogenase [Phormidesmis priestleyi Ana]|uniref:Short-chain dehydrogenase n=1 Tax=Phormidesmis priestleyi Ana TaxID=1666911 RepID=A0A0P7ZQH5_9CYAN|nr:MAG: Short-chain dehydrogenase [Phormidesmis priestleyi Ana]
MSSTALITGASSGIGLELAKVFAHHQHNLILVARSEDKLQALSQELSQTHGVKVTVLSHDLTNKSARQTLFDQVQQQGLTVDVLVNNAGYGDYNEFANSDWDKLEGMILLNVLATTHLTRLFLPPMLNRKAGKILNVSSTAAFQPGPMMAVYFATKAYVLSFSEAIAAETEDQGITVSTLCPGPTQSEFIGKSNMDHAGLANSMTIDKIPTAAEVAKFGYEALQKGEVVAVHGLSNKLMAFSTRLAPRGLLRKGVKQLMASN